MKDKTIKERMQRYDDANKAKGVVVVKVRVPADQVDEIKRIAAAMREGGKY